MVDRYWRKIEDVENDIENAMQISGILLKHKEYDDDLGNISTNTGAISTNTGNISINTGAISTNTGNISTNTGAISTNTGLISANTASISNNSNLISTNTGDISTNSGLISTNTSGIASNLSKINDIENDITKTNNIYNETFVISNATTSSRSRKIFEKTINLNFTTKGIIKINTNCNYRYDANYNFKHIYYFFNNNNVFKKISFDNNRVSNVVKDEFNIESVDSTSIRILIYLSGNHDYTKIELFGNNTIQIIYSKTDLKLDINKDNIASNLKKINDDSSLISTNTNDIASNSGLISTNTGNISANSGLISTNTGNISANLKKINALQTSNIKAFYNLDQIFIFDIATGHQTVNRNSHFHIFEKEIFYNFVKNSYLEIILKVLTEISNYVLIGYFQILCNSYDDKDNLFYSISLSTAMGSINKLSTIKSVFIVPINEDTSKIKIDFFIMPKVTQQNRSAKFIIVDINSNKIYVKYFQKTDEMSIREIQDSLNTVNNITSRIDNIEKGLYLKNLFNTLYHDDDIKVSHIFFDKTYLLNAKKDNFLEIYFKLLLKYDDISNAKYVDTNFIFYDMSNGQQLFSISYNNSDYISNTNNVILLNNAIQYNFDIDVNKLKIAITFSFKEKVLNILYQSINSNCLIVKHYGN